MAKETSLKKPMPVSKAALMAFVEGEKGAANTDRKETGQRAGLVPTGDVRLTANIQADLHLKLKIRAAQERTTVGELIEQWVAGWK